MKTSLYRIRSLSKARKLHKRIKFAGMDISIENRKGSTRTWYDPNGKVRGSTLMKYDYGYIRRTEGTDGDHVDVYLGPHSDSDRVFIVNQKKMPDFKEFDEQKVMLGFRSPAEAKAAYLKQYSDKRFFGSMIAMRMKDFKERVFNVDQKGIAIQKSGKVMILPPVVLMKGSQRKPPGFPNVQHDPTKPDVRGYVGGEHDANHASPTDAAQWSCVFTNRRGAETYARQIGRADLDVVYFSAAKAKANGLDSEGYYVREKYQERMLVKADKPPPGFQPVKNSKKGGYKKRIGGKWVYWYPGQPHPKAARGKAGRSKPRPGRDPAPRGSKSGEKMPVLEGSRAKPGTGVHKMENGEFYWKKSREYDNSADGHQMQKTQLRPAVDDQTKMQLLTEFRPLMISEAKKARRLFALKDKYEIGDSGRHENQTQMELMSAGMEGMLKAIESYKADVPFAAHAQMYVRDYVRMHAAKEFMGGVQLPDMHVRNLSRFIAARAQAAKVLSKENPTPREVVPFFDLRKKHVHAGLPAKGPNGEELRNAQIPDTEGYKLGLGRRGTVQKRGKDGSKTEVGGEMRDLVDQPSKLDWAEMYHGFLTGQKGIEAFDEQVIFPGAGGGIGFGFQPDDQIAIRQQVQRAVSKIEEMGSVRISHQLSGTKKPAEFRIDSLGEILMRKLGVGHEPHSARELAKEVPIYKMKADGTEKAVGQRNAIELMQKFVEQGMTQLKDAVEDKRAKALVDRAKEAIAPTKAAPAGPTFNEMLKEEAKQIPASAVSAWRERMAAKHGEHAQHIQRMSDDEVKMELAKQTRRGKRMSAAMRKLATQTIDVERISKHEGVAYMYDPVTKQHSSVRVRMNYDKDFDLNKSLAEGLSDQMIHQARNFPNLMTLLASDDPVPSVHRTVVQRMLGWY